MYRKKKEKGVRIEVDVVTLPEALSTYFPSS